MKILCFAVIIFVAIIVLFSTSSCAPAKFYIPDDNCRIIDSDDFYTCYYIKDGVMQTYKKPIKHRRSVDE